MGALCLIGLTGLRAWSQQEERYRYLREALISPTTAYIAMAPQLLCAAGNNDVSVSPDGKDALILHVDALVQKNADALLDSGEAQVKQTLASGFSVQLLLFSQGDDHAQVVWRGGGTFASGLVLPDSPDEAINWLPGARSALLTVRVAPPQPADVLERESNGETESSFRNSQTKTIFLINSITGKSQVVGTNLDPNSNLLVSTTEPVAVLIDVFGKHIRRIDANGKLGPALPVNLPEGKKEAPIWFGFLADGKTLMGVAFEKAGEGTPRQRVNYRFDTLTGNLTEVYTRDKPIPHPAADAEIPFTVQREKQRLNRGGVSTMTYPLWLEGRDKSLAGRTLLAADSDVKFPPKVLQSAIVYQSRGAIFATPILKSNAPAFLAQRREAQKRETLQRAKQIGLAMMMYAQDYDENFPTVGGDLAGIVSPYLKNDNAFQNPATGQNGFTPLYKMTSLSAFEAPAMTPLGTLSGPGGTAVIYADGHVKWQDDGTGK